MTGAGLPTGEVLAPAKVNLALHVTGRRSDGYHIIDSLVAFADFGDRIRLSPAAATTVAMTGPFADAVPTDERNLAGAAARGLAAVFPGRVPPVRIDIVKEIPVSAGLGGASADAAATLRALCRLAAIPTADPAVRDLALSLGADVPVCLLGCAARMRGIGEHVVALATPLRLHAVIAKPAAGLSTAEVFARLRLDGSGNGGLDALPDAITAETLAALRNDLERPAAGLLPDIGPLCRTLGACDGAILARMTGSGSACFALFATAAEAERAAAGLRMADAGLWVRAARLA
ncbi:MAG TPA: 4-(cytidine 5'-diphospho)-2-C-methyl-D-erythritol kinase [Aestuariivirgaceae bacterium]|nr:4-(cytidine 5'-diphospho)-2-C-methyl-D-erythritol kinase [Aestuariivirgaceae bacterium]